jgi:hypothetical protein
MFLASWVWPMLLVLRRLTEFEDGGFIRCCGFTTRNQIAILQEFNRDGAACGLIGHCTVDEESGCRKFLRLIDGVDRAVDLETLGNGIRGQRFRLLSGALTLKRQVYRISRHPYGILGIGGLAGTSSEKADEAGKD